MTTEQISVWTGEFGANYTERCKFESADDFNQLYIDRYGATRDDLTNDWLGFLPKNVKILEIGTNVGNQLAVFQRLGFQHLYGIEIQRYAIEQSRQQYSGLDIVQSSAFDIPFKDGFFDVVFTNNVLIHISPDNIKLAMEEIMRVSKSWIWGFEYFAQQFTEITYRGNTNLLWKADYAAEFVKVSKGVLTVEREKLYPCLDEPGLEDKAYLLRKE